MRRHTQSQDDTDTGQSDTCMLVTTNGRQHCTCGLAVATAPINLWLTLALVNLMHTCSCQCCLWPTPGPFTTERWHRSLKWSL
eukprot:6844334-Alexandrium_andersonii.AAC.1